MHRSHPLRLVLATGLAALVPLSSLAAQSSGSRRTVARLRQQVDSLLEPLHARGYFNGAVVLGRGDDEVYARGFGPANRGAGVRFTPDTPADGGSIAKTLTAAAIFMLEDAGRLRLDDPVRRYVPEYPHAETRVRDLITHSAGLPETEYDYFEGLIPADTVKTTLRFLDVLRTRSVPPEFPRGTRFRYSSLAFDVAALVIERASGQKWDAFLGTRVFEPLGMRTTFLRPARFADWRGVRTLSYRREGDTLALFDVFDNEGFYGGSNLYFSARDLHRWSRSFYTRSVLTPAAIARGDTGAILADSITGIAGRSAINLLGWYYSARERRYHYPGALQGFWGSVYRDEAQRYSIIYLSNNSMPQWLRPLLTRALIDLMDGRQPALIVVPDYVDVRGAALADIAGRYVVDAVGRVTLTARGDRLFVRVGEGLEYPTFPLGDGTRYVPGLDVWLGFPAAKASTGTAAGVKGEPRADGRLQWLSIFTVADGRRVP